MLSKGRKYRETTFDPQVDYWPMIAELDGFIFTDYDVGYHKTVQIYREEWMMPDSRIRP